jgi:transcriptional regulator with XRE-family HTH domain
VIKLDIIDRIKDKMKETNMSITDLSNLTGIGKSSFTGWFNREYKPSIKAIEKIADALEVSVDYLLGNTPPKPIHPSISVLTRASAKMTDEQIKQLENMAKVLFPNAFEK